MNIKLIQGDITVIQADAIVNAANQTLMGGGGVDGAIHRKGGPAILEACMKIRDAQGGCPTGQAVITTAGKLPAKWVIHTVGPVYGGDHAKKAQLLRSCYLNSLKLAVERGAKTVAFPNISTGVYRYPKQEAAEIAIRTVRDFEQGDALDEVTFVCFDDENYNIYQQLL